MEGRSEQQRRYGTKVRMNERGSGGEEVAVRFEISVNRRSGSMGQVWYRTSKNEQNGRT